MEINVLIDGKFRDCPGVDWFQNVIGQVLTAQEAGADVELSLVITGQEKVRELNRSYRGIDELTDVLAFFMTTEEENEAEPSLFIIPPDGVRHLGEVIISYPQVVIQARERKHSLKKELAILIVHGVLHLLGYDHEKPEQEQGMRAREREILRSIELDAEGLISP